jgi:hypothetical protein
MKISKKDTETIDKWIFILLSIDNFQEIRGRVRFTKEMFYFIQEYDEELNKIFNFFPHQFGAYSSRLAERTNYFIMNNIIDVEHKGNEWRYSLNKNYREKSVQYLSKIKQESLEKLTIIKESFNKLSTRRILEKVYTEYPEFTISSAVVDDILYSVEVDLTKKQPINDGRGFTASVSQKEINLSKNEFEKIEKYVN